MAVHLLEGHTVGGRRARQIIGQREKLLALGTITAGLTHQLNNPAAATARAVSDLREKTIGMRHKLAMLADGKFTPEALRVAGQHPGRGRRAGRQVQERGADRAGGLRPRGADRRLARGPRHRGRVGLRADVRRCRPGHRLAGTSLGIGRRGRRIRLVAGRPRMAEIHHRDRAVDEPDRRGQQANLGAARRGQAVLADGQGRIPSRRCSRAAAQHRDDVRRQDRQGQCGQTGQGPRQVAARIACYPGDLNQVWTNIIDNAIQAMDGSGTLTLRTMRENEEMIRVEICDDGPGIPEDIIENIFNPFFTTKPFGEGTGLGLDLARRIVVEKHHGDLRVESEPGRHHVHRPAAAGGARARSTDTDRASGRRGIAAHRAAGWRNHDGHQTRPRPVRIIRTRRNPRASEGNRGAGLRRRLGRRVAAGRAGLGGAHPRTDHHAAGGDRHRQHLDRGRRTRRRVVPPHRGGLPRPLPAGHRRRPSRGRTRIPQALSTRSPNTSTSSTSTACRRTAAWWPRWARRWSSCPPGAAPARIPI